MSSFDFTSRPKKTTSFLKKIRIHPRFLSSFRDIRMAAILFLLSLVFVLLLTARNDLRLWKEEILTLSSYVQRPELLLEKLQLSQHAPQIFRGDFSGIYTALDTILYRNSSISWLYTFSPQYRKGVHALDAFMGVRVPHDVIIWLQNDAEVRPTGGFVGSFLRLRIEDAQISAWKLEDIYDADNQVYINDLESPSIADSLIGKESWSLRDANVFSDFSKSAEQFLRFLEMAKSPSAETVIAVDVSLMEELLSVYGDLSLFNDSITFSSDDLGLVLSYFVEGKYSEYPKAIIEEVITSLVQKKVEISQLLQNVWNMRSHIQVYSRQKDIQDTSRLLGLSHEVDMSNTMLLQSYSIGGNKSDRFIDETFSYTCEQEQCSFQILRFHSWSAREDRFIDQLASQFPSRVNEDILIPILGKGGNKRVYQFIVPKGVKHISPDRRDIRSYVYEESMVYEWEAPELFPGETQKIGLSFSQPGYAFMAPGYTQYFDEYGRKVE